jgi:plastocyanin
MFANRPLLMLVSVLTLLGAASPQRSPAADATTIVMARDFMFAPTSLTVKAGSTVTWTNKDDEPHTVVRATGLLLRSGAPGY